MSDQPLDARTIGQYLSEVADELAGASQRAVIVAGGALLALHGLRESTRDVDSVLRIDNELETAVNAFYEASPSRNAIVTSPRISEPS